VLSSLLLNVNSLWMWPLSRKALAWGGELFRQRVRILDSERIVKPFLTNLANRNWLLLAMVAVVVSYPLVRIVVPAAVHAVVPEVVRTMLRVI